MKRFYLVVLALLFQSQVIGEDYQSSYELLGENEIELWNWGGDISKVIRFLVNAITSPVKGDKGDAGERGPKGDKGDAGERGPKGDTGDRGSDGIDGQDGQDGRDASVLVKFDGKNRMKNYSVNLHIDGWSHDFDLDSGEAVESPGEIIWIHRFNHENHNIAPVGIKYNIICHTNNVSGLVMHGQRSVSELIAGSIKVWIKPSPDQTFEIKIKDISPEYSPKATTGGHKTFIGGVHFWEWRMRLPKER